MKAKELTDYIMATFDQEAEITLTDVQLIFEKAATPVYILDEEEVDIGQFIEENWDTFSDGELRALWDLNLRKIDHITFGGGAAAERTLRRLR